MTSPTVSCGELLFGKPDGIDSRTPGALRPVFGIMGPQRITLLRAFYRRLPLPGHFVPCTHNPTRQVAWEDVRWDTCGHRITKEDSPRE